jgi:hypothetical protein
MKRILAASSVCFFIFFQVNLSAWTSWSSWQSITNSTGQTKSCLKWSYRNKKVSDNYYVQIKFINACQDTVQADFWVYFKDANGDNGSFPYNLTLKKNEQSQHSEFIMKEETISSIKINNETGGDPNEADSGTIHGGKAGDWSKGNKKDSSIDKFVGTWVHEYTQEGMIVRHTFVFIEENGKLVGYYEEGLFGEADEQRDKSQFKPIIENNTIRCYIEYLDCYSYGKLYQKRKVDRNYTLIFYNDTFMINNREFKKK